MNFLLGVLVGYLLFYRTNKEKENKTIIYCKQPTYKRPPRKL